MGSEQRGGNLHAVAYANWHRVLVHAFLGTDPGEGDAAELGDVAGFLNGRRAEIDAVRLECAAAGRPWPVPPTPDLAAGLPWAHYAARVAELRSRLGYGLAPGSAVQPPARPGHTDREVERLRTDRPPHWG